MTCNPPPFALSVLSEASRISPRRRKSSDGICASAAHHQQNPGSDHEPSGPHSYAHAVDVSQSTPGAPFWNAKYGLFDAHAYGFAIAQRMRSGEEKRVKYLVSFLGGHDVIFDPAVSMAWRENGTGTEHASHLHVSFLPSAEQSTAPFFNGGFAEPSAPATGGNPMYAPNQICSVYSDGDGHAWGLKPTGEVDTLVGNAFYGSYGTLQKQDPKRFPPRGDFAHITARFDGQPGYTLWPVGLTDPMQHYDFGPK
jgi:hypothetical protein